MLPSRDLCAGGQGPEPDLTDRRRRPAPAGFDRVPVSATFTFVMSRLGWYPDLQPESGPVRLPGRADGGSALRATAVSARRAALHVPPPGRRRRRPRGQGSARSKPVAPHRKARPDGESPGSRPGGPARRDTRRREPDRSRSSSRTADPLAPPEYPAGTTGRSGSSQGSDPIAEHPLAGISDARRHFSCQLLAGKPAGGERFPCQQVGRRG